jgi:hypothetical protein
MCSFSRQNSLVLCLFFAEGVALWFEAKMLDAGGDVLLSTRRLLPSLVHAMLATITFMVVSYFASFRREYRIDRMIAKSSNPQQKFVSWWVPPFTWGDRFKESAGPVSHGGNIPTRIQYPLMDFWSISELFACLQAFIGAGSLISVIEAWRALHGASRALSGFVMGLFVTRVGIMLALLAVGLYAMWIARARRFWGPRSARSATLLALASVLFGVVLIWIGAFIQDSNVVPMAIHEKLRGF